jgi:hypothetical protein
MIRTRRRFANTTVTILALAVAAPTRAGVADPAPFLAAQAEFERGLAGDGGANVRAHAQFQKLVEAEPANPLYLAYLGSTYTLLGRDAWAPWTRMRQTEKGLGLIDKALALLTAEHDQQTARGVPVSEEVRLSAAATFLAVPGFMNRTEAARLAIADALASPAFATTPGQVQARLLMQAALLARKDKKPGEEAEALKRSLAASSEGATAASARARLQELGQ